MKQAPGAPYTRSGKKGATKIELAGAKAALSELEADDPVVMQAKAPDGANSSTTSDFAARVLDAKTPPAPYYHDADADGIGDICEAPVVSDSGLTDPAPTGVSV